MNGLILENRTKRRRKQDEDETKDKAKSYHGAGNYSLPSMFIQSEKSPSTIDKYVRDVRKLQQYANGRILTKTLMLEYKRDLEVSSTYKATSINSYIAAINQFCQAMHWNDLCIKTIKVQRTAFEPEEKELTIGRQ